MKKLIVLCVLVAFTGFAIAELMPPDNPDFEAGMSGWGTWGSGSGSGSAGYKWTSHWAYIETSGGVGDSQFMNLTTAAQAGYCEWWGWGYNIIWNSDWASTSQLNPGVGVFTIGGWYKDLGNGGTGEIKFEWLDASQHKSGTQEWGIVPAESVFFPLTTDWAYYQFTLPVPAEAYFIRACWANPNPGGEVGLDDVVTIPEPMSIALLGLGGLFLRRRK